MCLTGIGSRIKHLLDTPETIWGCLDTKDYLDAAWRFVQSEAVHKAFTAESKVVARSFPLLQHQWPLVKKLKSQIQERAMEWLQTQEQPAAEQAAATLSALALLKEVDGAEVGQTGGKGRKCMPYPTSMLRLLCTHHMLHIMDMQIYAVCSPPIAQLLKIFLGARHSCILACIKNAMANSAMGPTVLAAIISNALGMICSTIALCGQLLLALPGVSTVPLLLTVLAEGDSSADMLFDAPGAIAPEAHAIAVSSTQPSFLVLHGHP